MTSWILGHGSGFGWDEALFGLAPLLLFAGLLVVAKRRAEALDDESDDDST